VARHRIYWDENIRIDDVAEFLRARIASAKVIDGRVVLDFNLHYHRKSKLRRAIRAAVTDFVVIPYNVAAGWTRMLELLPEWLWRTADLVFFDQDLGRYVIVPPIPEPVRTEVSGIVLDALYERLGGRRPRVVNAVNYLTL